MYLVLTGCMKTCTFPKTNPKPKHYHQSKLIYKGITYQKLHQLIEKVVFRESYHLNKIRQQLTSFSLFMETHTVTLMHNKELVSDTRE